MESFVLDMLLSVISKAEFFINDMIISNIEESHEKEDSPGATKEELLSAIKYILGSQELITQISERSYAHDNGFVKLVLLQSSRAISEVRIHLWGLDSKHSFSDNFIGNVHNHSANFASYILKGALTEEIYSIADASGDSEGITAKEFFCGSRGESHYYEMQYKGLQRIIRKSLKVIPEGGWHSLQNDALHRAYPSINPTVTLFFQSLRAKKGTTSLDISSMLWSPIIQSKPLTPGETIFYLNRTLEILND